jgi:hypothetical protein
MSNYVGNAAQPPAGEVNRRIKTAKTMIGGPADERRRAWTIPMRLSATACLAAIERLWIAGIWRPLRPL